MKKIIIAFVAVLAMSAMGSVAYAQTQPTTTTTSTTAFTHNSVTLPTTTTTLPSAENRLLKDVEVRSTCELYATNEIWKSTYPFAKGRNKYHLFKQNLADLLNGETFQYNDTDLVTYAKGYFDLGDPLLSLFVFPERISTEEYRYDTIPDGETDYPLSLTGEWHSAEMKMFYGALYPIHFEYPTPNGFLITSGYGPEFCGDLKTQIWEPSVQHGGTMCLVIDDREPECGNGSGGVLN